MTTHATYSPSKLSRIIACPGSVQLCQTVPKKPTSKYAEEGTLLHSYTEQLLEAWPEKFKLGTDNIEHEMTVIEAVNYIQQEIPFTSPGIIRYQELKVEVQNQVYGTLDFAAIIEGEVHIADFKFGKGVKVDAKDNYQMMAYMCGFLNFLEEQNEQLYEQALESKLYMHIVQPRLENYQKEEVTPQDLKLFLQRVDKAIRLANQPTPPFNPGPNQCRWCDAAGVCRAQLDQVQTEQLANILKFADINEHRASIPEIQEALRYKASVIQAYESMEKYLFYELAKGGEAAKQITQFKLVRGRSNRSWHKNVTFDLLTSQFEELDEQADLLFETKLKGPAFIEKLLPKERRQDLDQYINKPEGSLSLVDINHPKEAVIINDPNEVFSDYMDQD